MAFALFGLAMWAEGALPIGYEALGGIHTPPSDGAVVFLWGCENFWVIADCIGS